MHERCHVGEGESAWRCRRGVEWVREGMQGIYIQEAAREALQVALIREGECMEVFRSCCIGQNMLERSRAERA